MDTEFKKLLQGGKWADAAPDNTTPESTSITPVLDRRLGWPASYSQANGNVPDRRRINQLLRELSGGAFEVRMGVSQYDRDVDYPVNAISAVSGELYRALVGNGPSSNNVTNPTSVNNTVWEPVSGGAGIPDAPVSFHYDNNQELGAILVRFKPGKDNGARLLGWEAQYKTSPDGAWIPSTPQGLGFAEWRISGLAVGTRIYVQARAYNSVGNGTWGEDETGGLVTGRVPDGGNELSLLATAISDSSVRLNWQRPHNGGHPITGYTYQWRAENETYLPSRQGTISDSFTVVVGGLTTDVKYFFRVSASNTLGPGLYSNIATATPTRSESFVYHPTLNAPTLNAQTGGRITATTSLTNSSIGRTADVTQTVWQIKRADTNVWPTGTTYTSGDGLVTHTWSGLEGGISYDVRYQVLSSAEPNASTAPFSASSRVIAVGAVPAAPISVGGSAWWRRTDQFGGGTGGGGMSWSITPGADNGSPITNYQVAVTFPSRTGNTDPTQQGTTPVRLNFTTSRRSGTYRNISIAKGGQGTISARAMNANGWGPWKIGQTITVGGD